jgi:OmpA-OmpF porin, OOP family
MTRWFGLAAAAALVAVALPSSAQAQTSTFTVDRLRIGGAPDDGIGVWRPEIADRARIFGQLALGFSLNPLRVENEIDDQLDRQRVSAASGAPLETQFTGYMDVGFELFRRFSFQMMLPVTFAQTGNRTNVAGVGAANEAVDLAVAAPGDMRFEARGVIVRTNDDFFKLGANAMLFAPSGNEQSYTGDTSTSGGVGLAGELDWKKFILTLDTGFQFRPEGGLNQLIIGHEWNWGLAGFLPLRDDRIRIGLSVFGSMAISGDDKTSVQTTPAEWQLEGRFALDEKKQAYINGFGGTRITPGYAPDFRTGVAIGYWFNLLDTDPPAPKKDYRADTMRDNVDTDKDGYPDNIDLCPTVPEDGKPPYTTDGCPAEPDRDGDGIPDYKDKCPDVPEDFDKVDDQDGCPEDDADKDGILDGEDACPKEPGEKSPEKDKNGCPKFIRRIQGSNEIQVLKKVEFDFGSARLSAASFPILDEVVRLMQANPDITLLSIEGHTDSVGSDQGNLLLSKNRAKSCLDYLEKKGVAAKRLTSEGFGEGKPIETNDTAEGRGKNRRTEFHIKTQGTSSDGKGPAKPNGGAVPGE